MTNTDRASKYVAANNPWPTHNAMFILTLLELSVIIQMLDKQHLLSNLLFSS